MPLVGVVMGSKSDAEAVQPALDVLKELGIEYEVNVISAHRTPEKARQYGLTARERGMEVIIAAAGGAAHLPGVLASWTTLPVIGVPLPGTDLKGVDALYVHRPDAGRHTGRLRGHRGGRGQERRLSRRRDPRTEVRADAQGLRSVPCQPARRPQMIERYSRPRMKRVWSDQNKFGKWLQVEIAACEAWAELGVVPQSALPAIRKAKLQPAADEPDPQRDPP